MGYITVKLRVVGLFLGNKVTGAIPVQVEENPTVADLLTALVGQAAIQAIPNVTALSYSPFRPLRGTNQPLNRITVTYAEPFTTFNNRPYEAGTYELSDQTSVPGIDLVWQYYVFDENMNYVLKPGFEVPFSELPNSAPNPDQRFEIKDGWTVIWRLVALANGPTPSKLAASRAAQTTKCMKE